MKPNGNGHQTADPLALIAVDPLMTPWDWAGSHQEHFVQFYEHDDFIVDSLCRFVVAGLGAGETIVVAATGKHLQDLDRRLKERGIDPAAITAAGHYQPVNAENTLALLKINGQISADRFRNVIGGIILRSSEAGRPVRVFGELVALLSAEGKFDAAVQLEGLWNELKVKHPFSLFCAYPMQGFSERKITEVCVTHSQVIPAESFTSLPGRESQGRAIAILQQKAQQLEKEIGERLKAEEDLRIAKEELETQVADLRRLHELNERLTSTLDVDELLNQVLEAALMVQNTDMGVLSLCDASGELLTIRTSKGFDPEFLKTVSAVPAGSGACGTCLQNRTQIVVEDVNIDPLFEPYRKEARLAGFRSCHSTPLITRDGTIIGVLSVHFREPRKPSERQMQLMDLYAGMATSVIENARLHRRIRRALESAEEALTSEQIARSEAETANRMKDEFLATVSHELRTPLNPIIGWTHMLRRSQLDDETKSRALETIERNAKSQAQLVEDILDVSRMITGNLKLQKVSVDLASVINAAVDAVQLAASSKSIELQVTLDPYARRVLGDANRLQQIVWNLLSNAIKFTPAGGNVAISIERKESQVAIKVTDTGQGIPKEFLPFVFDRFRQADGGSTRRHGGLGLGLALVRHLVELHGGSVSANSEGDGRGSTFTIELPLAYGTYFPSQTVEANSSAGVTARFSRELSVPLPSLNGRRILLVDDDADTLQMLSVMLSECHAEVQVASSAEEALEMLDWYRPHVLVLDLAMPGEDGYSLIQRIRRHEQLAGKSIPAVALTAQVRVEDRARALSSGFNMFVPKPVEADELINAISNLTSTT